MITAAHLINQLHHPLQKGPSLLGHSCCSFCCIKDTLQALRVHLARNLSADVDQIIHGHAYIAMGSSP